MSTNNLKAVSETTAPTPTYNRDLFTAGEIDNGMPTDIKDPRAVRQLIYGRLDRDDRNPNDFGSFICDYMDPEFDELMKANLGKSIYPGQANPNLSMISDMVVQMIQKWYNGTPITSNDYEDRKIIGSTTVGSSEAIMLGLSAHVQNWWDNSYFRLSGHYDNVWQHAVPFVMYARDVHTCWDKYSEYFNVPALVFNLSEGNYTINPDDVNTALKMTVSDVSASTKSPYKEWWPIMKKAMRIGGTIPPGLADVPLLKLVACVGGVIGTTFTGEGDPIGGLNDVLADIKSQYPNWDLPIHVDAASAGFVAPFTMDYLNNPELIWDFRLEHVKSINVSNHKFGMVYPGCGTVVFANSDVVPTSLVRQVAINKVPGISFDVRNVYNYNKNRNAAQVLGAFYNLKRFGKQGFQKIAEQCVANSAWFSAQIEDINNGYYQVLSESNIYPEVVFKVKGDTGGNDFLLDLSDYLKANGGYDLPAYPLPYNSSTKPDGPYVMRVVTRQDVDREKLILLLSYIVAYTNKYA